MRTQRSLRMYAQTHTHTQSSHYTIIYHFHFHTRTPFFSVAFDTHHTSYSWQNKNTQYYQYWEHTHQHKYILFSDFYICPIHVMKAHTRSKGKTLFSLNLNIRWRCELSSCSSHFTLGKKPDAHQSGGCTGPRACLNMFGGDKSSSNWDSNSGLY